MRPFFKMCKSHVCGACACSDAPPPPLTPACGARYHPQELPSGILEKVREIIGFMEQREYVKVRHTRATA